MEGAEEQQRGMKHQRHSTSVKDVPEIHAIQELEYSKVGERQGLKEPIGEQQIRTDHEKHKP